MPESIALDISEHAVYAVALEGSGRKIRVKGHYSALIKRGGTAERKALIQEAVEDIFSENKLDRSNVVVTLSSRKCLLRQFWLPFIKPDQIAKTLPYEVENQLQSCDLTKVVLSFAKIRETNRRSEMLVVAAPREEIEGYLEILRACKIDPVAIDLDIAALYNAVRHSELGDLKGCIAVADLHEESLRIVVLDDGDLRLGRCVGISPVFDSEADPQAYLSAISREIRRTLAAGNFSVADSRLFATGRIGGMDGFPERLGEDLGFPVGKIDFVGRLAGNGTDAPECTVALGGGYKGLGRDLLKFDFRKGDYVYKTGYEVIKRSIAGLVSLALILFFVAGQYVQSWTKNIEKTYAHTFDLGEKIWSSTILKDEEYDPFRNKIAASLESRYAELSGMKDADKLIPPVSCSQMVLNVNDAVAELAEDRLFAKHLKHIWNPERRTMDVYLKGSFNMPFNDVPWEKFKDLLAKHTGLKIIEQKRTRLTLAEKGMTANFEISLTTSTQEGEE